MVKRDLILDQIEQMGAFLRKLLDKFANSNSLEDGTNASDSVTNEMIDEIGFDLKLFLTLSEEEARKYLSNYKFTEEHLETLSNLLVKMSSDALSRKEYLEKALLILDFTDEISSTFSFERNNTKNKIRGL
ncbi:hypothetical protein ACFSX9_02915 [Flavobacterium ardleyense]|uniref:Uncharacterized protein n=1 Tax=Flavobacterium ardleyense TaxID=2038737 RepID=A0ABW5Z4N4_9FLAO